MIGSQCCQQRPGGGWQAKRIYNIPFYENKEYYPLGICGWSSHDVRCSDCAKGQGCRCKNAKASSVTVGKTFMVAAAQGGTLEVRLGEIAMAKGSRQEVKDFGAMMISDHGKAGEDLKAVAAKQGVKLPLALDTKHEEIVNKLGKLSGAAFDKAYIDEMVKAHIKDASAFEEASKNAKDPDVKAFAQRTLPVVKARCEKVESMAVSGKEKNKK
jgi:putative membrane protein